MNVKRVAKKTIINGLIGLLIGSLYMVIMIFEKEAIKYLVFSTILGLIMGWIIEILTFFITKLLKIRGDKNEG